MVKKWKRKKNSKMWIPTTKFQKSVSWSFQLWSNVIEHHGQKKEYSVKKFNFNWLLHDYAFNFAQLFGPFSPISTLPYQNCRANLKSYWHFRAKLKYVLLLLHSAIARNSHLETSLNYTFFQIFAPCAPWG